MLAGSRPSRLRKRGTTRGWRPAERESRRLACHHSRRFTWTADFDGVDREVPFWYFAFFGGPPRRRRRTADRRPAGPFPTTGRRRFFFNRVRWWRVGSELRDATRLSIKRRSDPSPTPSSETSTPRPPAMAAPHWRWRRSVVDPSCFLCPELASGSNHHLESIYRSILWKERSLYDLSFIGRVGCK